MYVKSVWYTGETVSKGLNLAMGTIFASILAPGIAELSMWAGKWQEIVILISIFIAGTLSSYVKQYPPMKPYDYGFRVFSYMFTAVLVSGNSHFFRATISRLFVVGVGASVGLTVSICIYPIWAGEDLHKLAVKNMRGVAVSLEECVKNYLECVEYERIPSKILVYQATDDLLYTGYRTAIESASEEDALLGFAIWEPPHGPYKMLRYPWSQFVEVSAALRRCAFMVMSMHGCILSEIQAPPELRLLFRNEIQRVGIEGAKVLQELGNKLEKLEKLSLCFDLLDRVHEAAEDLQMLIDKKSYHLVKPEKWEAAKRPKEFEDPDHLQDLKEEEIIFTCNHQNTFDHHNSCYGMNFEEEQLQMQMQWPSCITVVGDGDVVMNEREIRTYESASALSLTNFTSSLIEFVARLQNLLSSYQELSDKAMFSEPLN
ncbi:hypothetical protein QVD17_21647 [Tagetes erecta]|uniref:Aluminum-activated malate transporter 9 n=1 Tax=Tagetes erecta TaxID=13708 RepID=A0AAD8KC75_TARER|nr:hypothetical protein QVD17_21647 [Tagetes erecta]